MNNRHRFSREQNRAYFMNRLPGQVIRDRAQVNMRCPFHDDRKASLSLNLDEGTFNCHACNEKGVHAFPRGIRSDKHANIWVRPEESLQAAAFVTMCATMNRYDGGTIAENTCDLLLRQAGIYDIYALALERK